MTSHSIEGLSDGGLSLYVMAEAVHRGRFPSDREPTPFGELGASDTEYCYRIAKSVQRHLSAAPSDGWVLVPREPGTCELDDSGWLLTFVSALHPPGTAAPVSWGDFSDEQRERIKTAYRAMLSAAPERVEGGGWEPIESAPRDGRAFLAYRAKSQRAEVVRWVAPYVKLGVTFGGEFVKAASGWPLDVIWELHTHWQPLPSPPIGAEGGRPTSAGVSGCGEGTQEPSPSGARRSDGKGG